MQLAADAGIHVVRVTGDRWKLEPHAVMGELCSILRSRRQSAA
jgi:hypothetical protein